jgi:acetyl-CoA C-acetyltransferase
LGREVFIISGVRTPIGNFSGSLSALSASELGAVVIAEVIKKAGIERNEVDEVIMGNVLPAGLGQNPARQAMLKAGLPYDVGATTINKVCGSGLKAVMMGAQAIFSRDAEVVVAGGMESMSQAPYYLDKARFGSRMGNVPLIDGMIRDGLWDVINDFHMGYTAELVAEKYGVSRKTMDEFACNSYEKVLRAMAADKFEKEIVPIEVPQKKGKTMVVKEDECPRETTLEALSKLKPAFKPDGKVTAGNSSKISDGAAAVLLMSGEKVKEKNLRPLARVVAQGSAGVKLEDVLVAPIWSIPRVVKKAGLKIDDLELHEINEAFAASTVAVIKTLGLDPSRVNVNGGAIALGHPIGASGARILVALLNVMQERRARIGMASLCLGGAEAVSLMIENQQV